MNQRAVWDRAFGQGDEQRSWYESWPSRSLNGIESVAPSRQVPIIDVGGGSSRLPGALLAAGYTDLTVLDISETALALARRRLGEDADRVNWVEADLLAWQPTRRYRVWHDRAVLHFFVDPTDRRTYVEILHAALALGGHAIIATFAPDGPSQCSGLPVQRHSADEILKLLGSDFTAIDTSVETHTTPSGKDQPFTWVIARRRPADPTAESQLGSAAPAPVQAPSGGDHRPVIRQQRRSDVAGLSVVVTGQPGIAGHCETRACRAVRRRPIRRPAIFGSKSLLVERLGPLMRRPRALRSSGSGWNAAGCR